MRGVDGEVDDLIDDQVDEAGELDEVLVDPVGVVVRLIGHVDQHLQPARVGEIVSTVVMKRSTRRRLAEALRENPSVLRTGQSPAPLCLARLLVALRKAGAEAISLPRCAECGRERYSVTTRRGGRWRCTPCHQNSAVCAGCGEPGVVASRDRHGEPRCWRCPDTGEDPRAELVELVTRLDSTLEASTVTAALAHAAPRAAVQRRLAWAVIARPDLLTGAGHDAPTPAVLRFIAHLVAAGASVIVAPACPRCHQVKPLGKLLRGKRVCGNCFGRERAVPCSRCGVTHQIATRDRVGRPVCHSCLSSEPANLEHCRGCGHRKPVAVRQSHGPRCKNCRERTITDCGICGRRAVCEISRATTQPRCQRCQRRWISCSGCGTVGPLRGGTLAAPLCPRCVNPDPEFWGRGPVCDTTWQRGTQPCQRCVLDQRARDLLADSDGALRPEIVPFHQALCTVERPDSAQAWLAKPIVRTLLRQIAQDARPLTHELLDELPAGKTLAHLRAVLVATAALPGRDERLITLERWITTTVRELEDPTQREILHGYAVWHHLRRLRQRLGAQHVTLFQDHYVRVRVTAALGLLNWLGTQHRTLATCTQADLDNWTAGGHPHRSTTAAFIRWALAHRRAHGLSCRATRWQGPSGPHNSEKRWDNARRLLHDATLPTADRVAGLLLLLYAQRITTITELTIEHVHDDNATVSITLGRVPATIPEPLATLVRELTATRKASSILPAGQAWLFPGRRPGMPLSHSQLSWRLRRIGLEPGRDRSTALFALGDTYGGSWGNYIAPSSAAPTATARRGNKRGRQRPPQSRCRPKDLQGVPWRVVFTLLEHGWLLRAAFVWAKPNARPESVRDRLAQRHEMLFLLTTRPDHWWPHNCPGPDQIEQVWTVPTPRGRSRNSAPGPTELPRRCISLGCPPGGRVLDPFSGTGTTGVAALSSGRSFVGIDFDPTSHAEATDRLNQASPLS